MRIIVLSFCLLFALQVQAAFFSKILSKLRIPSYIGYGGLCRAIDEGRVDIAVELVKQEEALGELGLGYVINNR